MGTPDEGSNFSNFVHIAHGVFAQSSDGAGEPVYGKQR
jgi:hypothetical protein